jgi:hypothetical protein
VSELPDQVGRWTKKTMDRLFLAAGISGGYGEIDQSGARLDREGNPIWDPPASKSLSRRADS